MFGLKNAKASIFLAALIFLALGAGSYPCAQEACPADLEPRKLLLPFEEGLERKYRTPLAGEEFCLSVDGEEIYVPARDRRHVAAISLGSSFFTPQIGGHSYIPFAAFYYKNQTEGDLRRFRGVFSGVVNYAEFADGTWNSQGWELLLAWENATLPFPSAEVVGDEEVEDSEIYWGHFLASLGFGWRMPIHPYQCDNDFRAHLSYEVGYLYIEESSKTGDDVVLPPSTPVHQLHLRLRYDAFERNLVELPHRGWAWGADFTLGRREHWADHQFADNIRFSRADTRDYFRFTCYLVAAFDVPCLSERHRLLLFAHAGLSPDRNWDRFSAFRIGGGPNPSESSDLSRHPFPGALYDQFLVESYFMMTIEYRLELLLFLYVHVRGTMGWAQVAVFDDKRGLNTETSPGQAFSVGLTSAFLWDSSLYVEYAYDNRVVRQNDSGHAVLVVWSKEL